MTIPARIIYTYIDTVVFVDTPVYARGVGPDVHRVKEVVGQRPMLQERERESGAIVER